MKPNRDGLSFSLYIYIYTRSMVFIIYAETLFWKRFLVCRPRKRKKQEYYSYNTRALTTNAGGIAYVLIFDIYRRCCVFSFSPNPPAHLSIVTRHKSNMVCIFWGEGGLPLTVLAQDEGSEDEFLVISRWVRISRNEGEGPRTHDLRIYKANATYIYYSFVYVRVIITAFRRSCDEVRRRPTRPSAVHQSPLPSVRD